MAVEHSRVWHHHGSHMAMAPVRMVTHPNINWAHDCLTSVINYEMFAPSYKGFCIMANAEIYMAMLQIGKTPISHMLPSLAMLLYHRPTRGMLPQFNRQPVLCDNDQSYFTALIDRWPQSNEAIDTNIFLLYLQGLSLYMCVCVGWHVCM